MPQDPSNGTILAIDDDLAIRELLKALLERANFHVFTAADGQAGLLLAKVERPQVIVLDVAMPKMDGYKVLERLKADPDTRHIPVIMLTGKGGEKQIQSSFAHGAVFHMDKPFAANDLLQKIQAALLEAQEGDSGLRGHST